MRQRSSHIPHRDNFLEEYSPEFVGRWDELINWRARREAEGGFFQRVLREHGAKSILDIACGTGFHTVTLRRDGFEVTGSDGSPVMVEKAKENARRFGVDTGPIEVADWMHLTDVFPGQQYDAVLCLGNAFTHLFEERDRVRALKEIHTLLKEGGLAIIDQRNYDKILDKGFHSKHAAYYLGDTVTVRPESIESHAIKFLYEYADGATHHLTLCPIRQDYVTDLLEKAGFKEVRRYGDFDEEYDFYEPDFVIQVAKK